MGTIVVILEAILLSYYFINNNGIPKKKLKILLMIFLGFISLISSSFIQQVLISLNYYPELLLSGNSSGNFLLELLSFIICIGLVEEFFKLACIKLMMNKSKADIFLSAFVISITFATLEDFSYMWEDIAEIGYLRSILPFHLVCQVIMAYFLCKSYDYNKNGDKDNANIMLIMSLLIPTILHGMFDYLFSSVSNNNLFLVVLILSVLSFVIIFGGIKKIAQLNGVYIENEQKTIRNLIVIGINVIYIAYVLLFVLYRLVN